MAPRPMYRAVVARAGNEQDDAGDEDAEEDSGQDEASGGAYFDPVRYSRRANRVPFLNESGSERVVGFQ
jgi:hypothetical protein